MIFQEKRIRKGFNPLRADGMELCNGYGGPSRMALHNDILHHSLIKGSLFFFSNSNIIC